MTTKRTTKTQAQVITIIKREAQILKEGFARMCAEADGYNITIQSLKKELAFKESEVQFLREALLRALPAKDSTSPGDLTLVANGREHRISPGEVEAFAYKNAGGNESPYILAVRYVRDRVGCSLLEAKNFCDKHFDHLRMNRKVAPVTETRDRILFRVDRGCNAPPEDFNIHVAAVEHHAHNRTGGAIPFINAVIDMRELTGCSLKEAKDFCDQHLAHLKNQPKNPDITT